MGRGSRWESARAARGFRGLLLEGFGVSSGCGGETVWGTLECDVVVGELTLVVAFSCVLRCCLVNEVPAQGLLRIA